MVTSHFKTEVNDREEVFNRLFAEYITIMENKKYS